MPTRLLYAPTPTNVETMMHELTSIREANVRAVTGVARKVASNCRSSGEQLVESVFRITSGFCLLTSSQKPAREAILLLLHDDKRPLEATVQVAVMTATKPEMKDLPPDDFWRAVRPKVCKIISNTKSEYRQMAQKTKFISYLQPQQHPTDENGTYRKPFKLFVRSIILQATPSDLDFIDNAAHADSSCCCVFTSLAHFDLDNS